MAFRNSSPCRKSWVKLRLSRIRSQLLRGFLLTMSQKFTKKMKAFAWIPTANSSSEGDRNALLMS